jgi:hypothetical protein
VEARGGAAGREVEAPGGRRRCWAGLLGGGASQRKVEEEHKGSFWNKNNLVIYISYKAKLH